MRLKALFIITLILIISCSSNDNDINNSQIYPSFSTEIEVTIIGLSFDAMEPFVAPNGNIFSLII